MELFSAKGVVVHCVRRQLYQFLSFGELYNINGLKTVFLDTAKTLFTNNDWFSSNTRNLGRQYNCYEIKGILPNSIGKNIFFSRMLKSTLDKVDFNR